MKRVQRFVLDEWRAIDEMYKKEALPSLKPAAVLLTATASLITLRFAGRPSFFAPPSPVSHWFDGLPFPDLYPHLCWAAFTLVYYGVLPMLCIWFVLGQRVRDHGVRWVKEPKVWLMYAGLVVLVLPLVYLVSSSDAFLRTYPKYREAGDSWTQLLAWEVGYAFQFFMLEFFFRGFLIFALARYIGSLALFVMVVPYAMIHFGKPLPECVGSVFAGLILGTISLRTGSIFGGVVVHCVVAWSMDLFALGHAGKLKQLLAG